MREGLGSSDHNEPAERIKRMTHYIQFETEDGVTG
jgi:hypothetical protein